MVLSFSGSFMAVLLLAVGVSSMSICLNRNKKFYVFDKCARLHQVPQRGYEAFFDLITAEGVRYHKCFIGCIFVEYDMLRKDYTIDEGNMCAAMKTVWLIPDDQDLVIPRAQYCLKKAMMDRMYPGMQFKHPCEGYYELFDCFIKEIASFRDQTAFPRYHDPC